MIVANRYADELSDVAETVEDIRQTAKGLKDSLREMFCRKPSEEE